MNPDKPFAGKGKQTRILLVEDHPVFRLGMRELINQEEDLCVCGDADDIATAWSAIQELKPDMVVVDISLKGRNGIELIKEIHKNYKSMLVLVLSMHDESLYAERSFHAGAKGYIMKQEASESIVKAIRHVLSGKIYASARFMESLLNTYTAQPHARGRSSVQMLTDRELEVLQLIGEGLSTQKIAKQLNLSVKTVGTYKERIKEKLNLKNAAELIRYAVYRGKH